VREGATSTRVHADVRIGCLLDDVMADQVFAGERATESEREREGKSERERKGRTSEREREREQGRKRAQQ